MQARMELLAHKVLQVLQVLMVNAVLLDLLALVASRLAYQLQFFIVIH